MGAWGFAYLCGRGHLYHWIEDDLAWDCEALDEARELARKGCPCGDAAVFEVSHYGDINDCVCSTDEIPDKGILRLGEAVLRFRIPDAVDSQGRPIEAYRDSIVEIYDTARIPPNCRVV